MRITAARYEGGELHLETSLQDAVRFVYGFKAGEYEIGKARKKRSLDANAYAWSLITAISNAVSLPKETVYRRAICDCGQYEALYLPNAGVDKFARIWGSRGLGWVVERIDEGEQMTLCFAYYGSSAYDAKAMSRLIDNLIQECCALGIETKPKEYIDSLLEGWNG